MLSQVLTLFPNSFRGVSNYGTPSSAKTNVPKTRAEESSGEPQSSSDSLTAILDHIKFRTFLAIHRHVERFNAVRRQFNS
jgi:hypothetical protein